MGDELKPQDLHATGTTDGEASTEDLHATGEGAATTEDLHATGEPLETKDLHATSEPFKPTK
ncbi:hypothetical protein [Streptomyces sp. DSM 41921]|uniref:Sigma-like protein n=1 Tax=Streptomyces dubilierae TaxID=3075533 RepID=A0ABU2P983_9ACTN|nr:hypothetical protein [Streptomyces sp. DSM 41921]MDT0388426.1 hypothetical protein [Streptomyces sp. DSM 41921]